MHENFQQQQLLQQLSELNDVIYRCTVLREPVLEYILGVVGIVFVMHASEIDVRFE